MVDHGLEAWLRGAVDGVCAELQPAAHAFQHALEDVERAVPGLSAEALAATPNGAAAIAYHLAHMSGATDRLLTYARGEALSAEQTETMAAEKDAARDPRGDALLERVRSAVAAALAQLRATDPATLGEVRYVGRKRIESTVRDLLFHAGEHAARHAGQVVTMTRVVGPRR